MDGERIESCQEQPISSFPNDLLKEPRNFNFMRPEPPAEEDLSQLARHVKKLKI